MTMTATTMAREAGTPPAQMPNTSGIRDLFRPYSTLLALLLLMLIFELAGRVWNSDVQELVQGAISGESSLTFAELWQAILQGLTASDASFLSAHNLTNLTLQVSLNGILAIGMTFVILTGGIDLGVGSVVALCGVCLGLAQTKGGWSLPSSLMLAMAVGSGIGAINGFLISRFRIPPFVVSLGFLVIARGLALILSGSAAISPLADPIRFLGGGFVSTWVLVAFGALLAFGSLYLQRGARSGTGETKESHQSASTNWSEALVGGSMFCLLSGLILWVFFADRGLPVPVLILVLCAAAGIFVLSRTTFGRGIYALGSNETAAMLSGIPVKKLKASVYVVMGALAALAGIVLAGRLNSATPTEGQLMELDAIAAVVIGGTSLQGGSGRIQGSIIGAFIIGVLNNGMDMLELSTDYQMVTKGLIIVFAVWTDSRASRRLR
jgi:D-xylose transport system permease protein